MKKVLVIFGVFVLLFPINAKALTGNVVIECGKNQLNVGETATCYVRCKNFNDSVSSFHGVLVADSNLSIFDIQKDNIWEGAVDNGNIDTYTDVNKTGNFNILSFNIKLLSSGQAQISLNDIKIGDAGFNEHVFPASTAVINSDTGQLIDDPGSETPINHDISVNPETGSALVWFLSIISILSVVICLIFHKKKS